MKQVEARVLLVNEAKRNDDSQHSYTEPKRAIRSEGRTTIVLKA